MFLARVEGSVVSTKKEASMSGRKLLLLRPQLVDEKDPTKFRPGANTIVAVDTVGAGIGELVMCLVAPVPYSAALERSRSTGATLEDSERELIGCDHVELGAELMRAWQFPPVLVAMCACQSEPWRSEEHARECALVHVARGIARTLEADPASNDPLIACNPRAIELARLDGVALDTIITESLQHLADVAEVLLQRHQAA